MIDPGTASLPEPDTSYGGKGIDDFHKRGILASVRKGMNLLGPGKRRLLVFATILQVSLGLLDLLGIALVGLVAAVAVSGVGLTKIPAPVQNILDALVSAHSQYPNFQSFWPCPP